MKWHHDAMKMHFHNPMLIWSAVHILKPLPSKPKRLWVISLANGSHPSQIRISLDSGKSEKILTTRCVMYWLISPVLCVRVRNMHIGFWWDIWGGHSVVTAVLLVSTQPWHATQSQPPKLRVAILCRGRYAAMIHIYNGEINQQEEYRERKSPIMLCSCTCHVVATIQPPTNSQSITLPQIPSHCTLLQCALE